MFEQGLAWSVHWCMPPGCGCCGGHTPTRGTTERPRCNSGRAIHSSPAAYTAISGKDFDAVWIQLHLYNS